MAHAQKPDFVFRRNGRVHLNRRGRQFSRLLAAEVCASAVVMLDTPCSEVVWRVLATHSIRQFPLHFPSRASSCAITFQLDSTICCEKIWEIFQTNSDVRRVSVSLGQNKYMPYIKISIKQSLSQNLTPVVTSQSTSHKNMRQHLWVVFCVAPHGMFRFTATEFFARLRMQHTGQHNVLRDSVLHFLHIHHVFDGTTFSFYIRKV